MHAVDDLGDAIDVTRSFLTPFRLGLWLKLAIIVLFVSSMGLGTPTVPTGEFQMGEDIDVVEEEFDISTEEILLGLILLGIIAVTFWLVLGFIGAILEFVFINSLVTGSVHVRRYARGNLGRGIHLFLFRVAISVVSMVLVAVPLVYLLWGGIDLDGTTIAALAAIGLFAIVVFLLVAIIRRFTSEFVAPVMLLEERGLVSAWKRFWPVLRSNPGEYVVYLVLIWIIQFAAGIAAWFVWGIGLLVLAIPFVILFLLLVLLGPIGIAIGIMLAFLLMVVAVLWLGVIWTPIESYFKYYALLILGDTEPELDLIPEQRAAARADGGSPPAAETEDTETDAWGEPEEEDWDDDPDRGW